MWRACSFILLILIPLSFVGCSGLPEEQQIPTTSDLEGDGLLVLCYHRILPTRLLNWGRLIDRYGSEFSLYAISTEEFVSNLDCLQEHGVRFVTPREAEDLLTGKKSLSGKLALITFDDGDLSLYKHAFPILEEKHIPFLLFLIAGQAEKQWEGFTMCSWKQVKEMMESGLCTVGLHTYDLHYLDPEAKKPVLLLPDNETLFEDDTQKGIDCLEKQLDIEVKYFAYPYGFGTPQTDRILTSHGISNIFTLRARVNKPGSGSSFIGRVMVTPESWPTIESWARTK